MSDPQAIMNFTVKTLPGHEFEIKTHGNTYALSRNQTDWVLAAQTTGGTIAPKPTAPFVALGLALQALHRQYNRHRIRGHDYD